MKANDAGGIEARITYEGRWADHVARILLGLVAIVILVFTFEGTTRMATSAIVVLLVVLSTVLLPTERYVLEGSRLTHRTYRGAASLSLDEVVEIKVEWTPYGDDTLLLRDAKRSVILISVCEATLEFRCAVGRRLHMLGDRITQPGTVSPSVRKALGYRD